MVFWREIPTIGKVLELAFGLAFVLDADGAAAACWVGGHVDWYRVEVERSVLLGLSCCSVLR